MLVPLDNPGDEPIKRFIILSGPPIPSQEFNQFTDFCQLCPDDVKIIGASTGVVASYDPASNPRSHKQDNWGAFVVSSRFISPHIASETFRIASEVDPQATATTISNSIESLIAKFPHDIQKDYFQSDRVGLAKRQAPYDIEYKRPAFLFTQMPGMGANWQGETTSWPSQNLDVRFVEKLSAYSIHGLPIFGGSATTTWPPPNKEPDSWVMVGQNGTPTVASNLIAAMLVETDLKFSWGSSDGFETEQEKIVRVDAGSPEWEVIPEDLFTQPRRYHRFDNVSFDNIEIELIDDPSVAEAPLVPVDLSNDEAIWRTLNIFDSDTFLPNPPYQLTGGATGFLRPVRAHAALAGANVSRKSLLGAIESAVQSAKSRTTSSPECAAIVVSCRGRRALLGESAVQDEMNTLTTLLSDSRIFTVYGDGETCPTNNSINLHRNWTIATLLLCNDYCKDYEDAIRQKMHSLMHDHRVYQMLPAVDDEKDGHNPQSLKNFQTALKRNVRVRTGTANCVFRLLWPTKNRLRLGTLKLPSFGTLSEYVQNWIHLGNEDDQCSLVEYQVAKSALDGKFETSYYTKEEYFGNIKTHEFRPNKWTTANQEFQTIQFVIVSPIIFNGEFVGTLTLTVEDVSIPSEDDLKIADEIANVAAFSFHLIRLRNINKINERRHKEGEKLRRLLAVGTENMVKAKSLESLGKSVVNSVFSMLREKAHVHLLFANLEKNPTHLTCIATIGPNAVPKSEMDIILTSTNAADIGLSGWHFKSESDDVTLFVENVYDSDQIPPGSAYRSCFDDFERKIVTNFAIRLEANATILEAGKGEVEESSQPRRIGVLMVEAPHRVLDQAHKDVILQLARVCERHLVNIKRFERLKNYLKMLLREGIVEHAAHVWGPEIHESFPFGRRIISILFADVRGYTSMSEIIGERRMSQFLQAYYNMLAECIQKEGGAVDKLMGDGVMAIFGDADIAHIDNETTFEAQNIGERKLFRIAAENAVRAGLAIAERFNALKEEFLGKWRFERTEICLNHKFDIGVVVHTGKPMVGFFRSEAPNKSGHLTYTAVGRDVNITSRLCDKVDQNQICVSTSTYWYLKDSAEFEFAPDTTKIPPGHIKGIQSELEIFRVLRTRRPQS